MTTITPELQQILRHGSLAEIQEASKSHDFSKPDPHTHQNAFFYIALRTEEALTPENIPICTLLISLQVSPKQVDANGQTALFYACRDGNLAVSTFLIENGVPVNHIDTCNLQSAAFFACREGKNDILQYLHDHEANLNTVDKNGQTPLFYAASNGKEETVRLLISLGVDLQVKDSMRHTAQWFARERGHLATEQLLKTAIAALTPSAPDRSSARETGKARRSHQLDSSLLQTTKTSRASKIRALNDISTTNTHLNIPLPSSTPHSSLAYPSLPLSYPQIPLNTLSNASSILTANSSTTTSAAAPSHLSPSPSNPKMRCRIVCRPVGTQEWLLPDADALDDLEKLMPELCHWGSTLSSVHAMTEWKKKWTTIAKQLLDSICRVESAAYFLKPVDVQKLRCFDYFDIVKRPMDFSTLKQKLKDNRYKSPMEFLGDVSLIFENCRLYNAAGTPVAYAGVKTESDWNAMVSACGFLALQEEYDVFVKRTTILQKARLGIIESGGSLRESGSVKMQTTPERSVIEHDVDEHNTSRLADVSPQQDMSESGDVEKEEKEERKEEEKGEEREEEKEEMEEEKEEMEEEEEEEEEEKEEDEEKMQVDG